MTGSSPSLSTTKSNKASSSASSESNAPVQIKPSIPENENKSTKQVESNDSKSTASFGQFLNIGSLLDQASQKVNPSYPAFAKSAHVTGIVRVDLVIDEKGSVVSAQSTTGPPMLRQAAIDASTRWKFRPTIRDGKPVSVAGFLNFNFAPHLRRCAAYSPHYTYNKQVVES